MMQPIQKLGHLPSSQARGRAGMKAILFGNITLASLHLEVNKSQMSVLPDCLGHPTPHLCPPRINSKQVRTKPSTTRCRLEKHTAQAAGTFHLFKCFYLKKKKIKDLHGTTSSQHSYVLVIINYNTITTNKSRRGGGTSDFKLKKKGWGPIQTKLKNT